jgi:UDP-N-acetylmuramyl pentapeptide phosphotransferase/UDP-N-acetylglucosamine-1-phosphate transferase
MVPTWIGIAFIVAAMPLLLLATRHLKNPADYWETLFIVGIFAGKGFYTDQGWRWKRRCNLSLIIGLALVIVGQIVEH